jgi:hypothetical protein
MTVVDYQILCRNRFRAGGAVAPGSVIEIVLIHQELGHLYHSAIKNRSLVATIDIF